MVSAGKSTLLKALEAGYTNKVLAARRAAFLNQYNGSLESALPFFIICLFTSAAIAKSLLLELIDCKLLDGRTLLPV